MANKSAESIGGRCHPSQMKAYRCIILNLAAPTICIGAAAQTQSCVELRTSGGKVTISGIITSQMFAGPPNYDSIIGGDVEEKALVLELPRRMCADGGVSIEGSTTFDRVNVSSGIPALLEVMDAAVGRHVSPQREAFGSHTGHHRAPLALLAEEVTVR